MAIQQTTREVWHLSSHSKDYAAQCKEKGETPSWWRCGEWSTREEALAYLQREEAASRDLAWLISHSPFVYRLQKRQITVLSEEIL